jgi:hypothetical protein
VLFFVDRVEEKDLYYNFIKLHLTNKYGKAGKWVSLMSGSTCHGAMGRNTQSQSHHSCPIAISMSSLALL